MGRPRKTYFGEAEGDNERSGLLSSCSQDAITEAASDSASSKGQYQGLGKTLTPHSLSAPAGLSSVGWDECREPTADEKTGEDERMDQSEEPAEGDLVVIT